MPTEIVTAIIGLIGVIIGVIPTYVFMRQRSAVEIEKLRAETDKTKAEAEKIRYDIKKVETQETNNPESMSVRNDKIELVTLPVKNRDIDECSVADKNKEHSIGTISKSSKIPFRIDLAGGWLDQPFISKCYPGSVITISVEPTIELNDRSGVAASTRLNAIKLWGTRLPDDDLEKLAKILFCYNNPPGTKTISGSQDAIGIVYPGIAKSRYEGEYWPSYISRLVDESHLKFVEDALYLITLAPRQLLINTRKNTNITRKNIKDLADATDWCWEAIQRRKIKDFGRFTRMAFEAQVTMFPEMVDDSVKNAIEKYQDRALGWKLAGAGGGGYLIVISEEPIENAARISIRRSKS